MFFDFTTPKEKKRKEIAYKKMLYPFGDKQNEWENNILKELFPNKNKQQPSFKYICICYKESLIKSQLDPDEDEYIPLEYSLKKYEKMVKRMKIDVEDLQIIENLAKLQIQAKSFEQLPTIDDIKKTS